MEFQDDDIRKLAALSRLELTPQEVEQFRDQLTSVLSYVDQIAQASAVPAIPETEEARMRLDDVKASSTTREELLAAAPKIEEGHISVRSVK